MAGHARGEPQSVGVFVPLTQWGETLAGKRDVSLKPSPPEKDSLVERGRIRKDKREGGRAGGGKGPWLVDRWGGVLKRGRSGEERLSGKK